MSTQYNCMKRQQKVLHVNTIAKEYDRAANAAKDLAAFLKAWNGKVCNKRFFDALSAAIPGARGITEYSRIEISLNYETYSVVDSYGTSISFDLRSSTTLLCMPLHDTTRTRKDGGYIDEYNADNSFYAANPDGMANKPPRINAAAAVAKVAEQSARNTKKAETLREQLKVVADYEAKKAELAAQVESFRNALDYTIMDVFNLNIGLRTY